MPDAVARAATDFEDRTPREELHKRPSPHPAVEILHGVRIGRTTPQLVPFRILSREHAIHHAGVVPQRGYKARAAEIEELERGLESRTQLCHRAAQGRQLRRAIGRLGTSVKAGRRPGIDGHDAGALGQPLQHRLECDMRARLEDEPIGEFARRARRRQQRSKP